MSEKEAPPDSHAKEQRDYLFGFVGALALTLLAFATVGFDLANRKVALMTIAGLAAIQLVVQFRYFLHIDLARSHRDDLQLILFTGVLGLIMIGGTIWIIANQMKLMG